MRSKASRPKLDEDERKLSRSFRSSSWLGHPDFNEEAKLHASAKASKSERTNIRLPEADLKLIKLRAQELGLGYQTLIASLVHQYVGGNLVELSVVKRLFAQEMQLIKETQGNK